MQAINNEAIQMVLKGPGHNTEDQYLTEKKQKDFSDLSNAGDKYDEVDIPATCDVKESLIAKLEECDNKIYHLLESNKYLVEECQDPNNKDEVEEYK